MADLAELSPTSATALGIPGFDGELQDYSPAYWDAVAERTREMVMDVDAFDESTDQSDDEDDFDDVDHVTAATLRDRLCVELDKHHRGEDYRLLNVIASPVQEIRDTFLMMEPGTEELRSRMAKVPAALAGYRESLSLAEDEGHVAALRQIEQVISQCQQLAESGSLLENLGLSEDCSEVSAAREAFGELAGWLSEELAPSAPTVDGVGRERYALFSHEFVGDTVDLDEAYQWGLDRLAEIKEQQRRVVAQLYDDSVSVRKAFHRLNKDERYVLRGTDALRQWMQEKADAALAALDGAHFDIPEEARALECCIDPAGTGGIFYLPPADDFSRPGRMYWSVPQGQEVFHTWQELTTVFHEGVPGHHLQCCAALAEGENLNLWRRSACWISGHGEGWALYAEQLMADLGFHQDPATLLGLLDAQRLRAARVVLDIGVHLHKNVPEGSGTWDASYAKVFLRENSAMDEANLAFELNRYLGWPGQAPSYALGQRLWEQTRDAALAEGQSLREFHRAALRLGSVPLSVLADEVLQEA